MAADTTLARAAATVALIAHSACLALTPQERMRIAIDGLGSVERVLDEVVADQAKQIPRLLAPNLKLMRVLRNDRTLVFEVGFVLVPDKAAFNAAQLRPQLGARSVCESDGVGVLIRDHGTSVVYNFFARNGDPVFRQEIDQATCAALK